LEVTERIVELLDVGRQRSHRAAHTYLRSLLVPRW
jgi:hypothetical protein